jgi:hypothetical protein
MLRITMKTALERLMCRMLGWITVAAAVALPLSAHAETRTLNWQGQDIAANLNEGTRGPGLSREKLLEMAREAVPLTPTYVAPPIKEGGSRANGNKP